MEGDDERTSRRANLGRIVASALALLVHLPNRAGVRRQKRKRQKKDLPAREELNYTFPLPPGAFINLSNINGPVFIETADTHIAEVQTIRSALQRRDLDQQPLIVELTENGLSIRGERQLLNSSRRNGVRHRVTVKLPRQVELSVDRVNGMLDVREIGGSALLKNINGGANVRLGQAVGSLEIIRVNGGVQIALAQPQDGGIKIHRINGVVELHFVGEPNAELEVEEFRGDINSVIPLVAKGRMGNSRLHARMGSGGPLISIHCINGGVRLRQDEQSIQA